MADYNWAVVSDDSKLPSFSRSPSPAGSDLDAELFGDTEGPSSPAMPPAQNTQAVPSVSAETRSEPASPVPGELDADTAVASSDSSPPAMPPAQNALPAGDVDVPPLSLNPLPISSSSSSPDDESSGAPRLDSPPPVPEVALGPSRDSEASALPQAFFDGGVSSEDGQSASDASEVAPRAQEHVQRRMAGRAELQSFGAGPSHEQAFPFPRFPPAYQQRHVETDPRGYYGQPPAANRGYANTPEAEIRHMPPGPGIGAIPAWAMGGFASNAPPSAAAPTVRAPPVMLGAIRASTSESSLSTPPSMGGSARNVLPPSAAPDPISRPSATGKRRRDHNDMSPSVDGLAGPAQTPSSMGGPAGNEPLPSTAPNFHPSAPGKRRRTDDILGGSAQAPMQDNEDDGRVQCDNCGRRVLPASLRQHKQTIRCTKRTDSKFRCGPKCTTNRNGFFGTEWTLKRHCKATCTDPPEKYRDPNKGNLGGPSSTQADFTVHHPSTSPDAQWTPASFVDPPTGPRGPPSQSAMSSRSTTSASSASSSRTPSSAQIASQGNLPMTSQQVTLHPRVPSSAFTFGMDARGATMQPQPRTSNMSVPTARSSSSGGTSLPALPGVNPAGQGVPHNTGMWPMPTPTPNNQDRAMSNATITDRRSFEGARMQPRTPNTIPTGGYSSSGASLPASSGGNSAYQPVGPYNTDMPPMMNQRFNNAGPNPMSSHSSSYYHGHPNTQAVGAQAHNLYAAPHAHAYQTGHSGQPSSSMAYQHPSGQQYIGSSTGPVPYSQTPADVVPFQPQARYLQPSGSGYYHGDTVDPRNLTLGGTQTNLAMAGGSSYHHQGHNSTTHGTNLTQLSAGHQFSQVAPYAGPSTGPSTSGIHHRSGPSLAIDTTSLPRRNEHREDPYPSQFPSQSGYASPMSAVSSNDPSRDESRANPGENKNANATGNDIHSKSGGFRSEFRF